MSESIQQWHSSAYVKLKRALELEKAGHTQKALDAYKDGIEYLMRCRKKETNAARQRSYLEAIETYMTRAEQLKKSIVSAKPSPSPSSSTLPKSKPNLGRAHSNEEKSVAKVDGEMLKKIEQEIMETDSKVTFDSVSGLKDAKQALHEMVILPAMRPDVFSGLRAPPKGLLLFGPPGNGKTLIAKAVAAETNATFFNISAAALTSKWMGEGEKLVRALFALAKQRQPSIVFIDEIDSILSKRKSDDHESSRRIKTEFMIQFSELREEDHVVIIGATNLPEELDDAVMRRLSKRIFIPNPVAETRKELLEHTLRGAHCLSNKQFEQLVKATDGYSCSDIRALCQEAAMGPVRDLGPEKVVSVKGSDIKKISWDHFQAALEHVHPTVSKERLKDYEKWGSRHKAVKVPAMQQVLSAVNSEDGDSGRAPPDHEVNRGAPAPFVQPQPPPTRVLRSASHSGGGGGGGRGQRMPDTASKMSVWR